MDKQTRMRWKLVDQKYTTVQSFLGSGGRLLKVMIEAATTTIHVMEVHEGFMNAVSTKTLDTVKACKKESKKMLKEQGVNFYEEIRKKKVIVSEEVSAKTEEVVVCKV